MMVLSRPMTRTVVPTGMSLLLTALQEITINLYIAITTGSDWLSDLSSTSNQCIGITGFVGVVLMQVMQCYRTDKKYAEQ